MENEREITLSFLLLENLPESARVCSASIFLHTFQMICKKQMNFWGLHDWFSIMPGSQIEIKILPV